MNYFTFGSKIQIFASSTLDKEVIKELWYGFCSCSSNAEIKESEDMAIYIGNADILPMESNEEYTVNITEKGIAICGKEKSSLMRGLMSLLCSIENKEDGIFRIECGVIKGDFAISNRMVHLCVFPETPLTFFEKVLRLCGVLQYTHVVIEFWGMLKFNCLDSLSWKHGFEKAQVRPIIEFAKGMGLEIIPMFNHLGHASASRVTSGKHVVLDQAPYLAHLFSSDGWCWNITSSEVKKLLSDIRHELYDLCGEGEYFHLGCDEAYTLEKGYESNAVICEFLSDITKEIVKEGKRPIIWGDMLVPHHLRHDDKSREGDEEKCIKRLSAIAPETIIADWDYDTSEIPVRSALWFTRFNFDIIGCPWYETKNINAYAETIKGEKLMGIMETTWHTIGHKIGSLITCASLCGLKESFITKYSRTDTAAATLLRKVTPKKLPYEETGFVREQVREIIG